MRITATSKQTAVLKVINNQISVSKLAKELGVSRKSIYSWVKRYKLSPSKSKSRSLETRYTKGTSHSREYRHEYREKIIRLIKKDPTLSISKLSKHLKVGHHAVYNLLADLKLTTQSSRLAFSRLYLFPGVLDDQIKVSIVKSAASREKTITSLAKEYGVARKTIYKWITDYKSEGNLKVNYASGYNHPRAYPEAKVNSILSAVAATPSFSVAVLSKSLGFGHHGVYDALKRFSLTTQSGRLNYANAHRGLGQAEAPVYSNFLGRIKNFLSGLTPNLLPGPPPPKSNIFKIFVFSASLTLTTLFGISIISELVFSEADEPIEFAGLSIAVLALLMGTLFFLYSFKYYLTLAVVLSYQNNKKTFKGNLFSKILGNAKVDELESGNQAIGLEPDLSHISIKRKPFISVQIPFYNEKNVVRRSIEAAINFDYPEYEVILCDDSTDETTGIIRRYLESYLAKGEKLKEIRSDVEGYRLTYIDVKPGVTLKHLHRTTRDGYKGKALALALKLCDSRTEFVSVFDADFVPYPDTLYQFLRYFKAKIGSENYSSSNVAAVQGYQWHVLNKSENWITRGVRSEYAGSYIIERSGAEIYGGLKQISGSVYMIRKDVLAGVGWGNSITEDFELTLRLYEKGYKVLYTPYVQAPAECVSTLRRLMRQRMRWAEGHSFNIKKMFVRLLNSKKLTVPEKVELIYLSPYYLQAFFFLVGTFAWLVSETIFKAKLPFWTEIWGWSLVITNMISLPLLNSVGLFVEESETKDYSGIFSFIVLSYLIVPFQAYAAVKGLIEKEEGPWFRTPKTGRVTDIFTRNKFYRFIERILPGRSETSFSVSPYLAIKTAANGFSNFRITRRKSLWVGKAFLAILLIVSNLIISMAPSVPYFIKPETAHAQSFDVLGDKTNTVKDVDTTITQNKYPNGVLSLNTDRSYYTPGVTARLMIGALDKNGDTLCDADLTLNLYAPDESIKILNSKNGTIQKSASCSPDNNVTDDPDYFVNYKTAKKGVYNYDLINNSNGYQISGSFEVKNNAPVKVERISATRINPFKSDYKMKIRLTATENISGTIKESLPEGFEVSGDTSWPLNLKKGQSKSFEYTYQSPKISPELFVISPLTMENAGTSSLLETHGWMIASDNTCTAQASANWNLPTTWAAGCRSNGPIAGDTVNIGAFNVTVTTATPAATTVNFTGNGGTLTVNGTLTVSGAVTLQNAAAAARSNTIAGAGSLSAASVAVGNATNPTSGTFATTLTLTVSSLTTSGNVTINSYKGSGGSFFNNGVITHTSGNLIVGGTFTTSLANATNTATYTMGNSFPTLQLNGTTAWSIGGTGTTTTTLNGTGAVVDYHGTGAQTIRTATYTTIKSNNAAGVNMAGAFTTTNLTIGDVVSSSDFNDAGNQLTSTGTLTMSNSSIFTIGSAGTGTTIPAFTTRTLAAGTTIEFSAGVAQAVSTTPSYQNLTFSGAGTKTPSAGALNVAGNWAMSSPTALNTYNDTANVTGNFSGTGNLTTGLGLFTLGGDWTNTGTFTAGSGGVTFSGGSGTQITGPSGGITFTTLTINKAITNNNAGTIIVSTALNGSNTLTQGTNSTLDLDFTGAVGISGLNASTNTNTVSYTGSVTQTVKAVSYKTLTLGGTSAKTMTSVTTIGVDLNISGSATMTGNAAFTVTGALNYSSSGNTTLTSATNISIGKMNLTAGTITDNGVTITVTGTGASTWIGTGTYTTTGTATFTGAAPQIGTEAFNNLTINVGGGNTATPTGTITVGGNLVINTGTLAMGANDLNVGSTANAYSGSIMVASGATISQTAGTTTVVSSESGLNCIGGTGESCSSTGGIIGFFNLTIGDGSTSFTSQIGDASTVVSTGGTFNLTTNSSFYGSGTLNVSGDWTRGASSGFYHNNGTVNLTGAGGSTQTISGTNTFYNLSATASAARTIKFPSSTTTTISNSLTLTGSAGQLLSLSPSTAATIWTITPPATVSVNYLNVTYSTATTCINASNSSGSNNTLWLLDGSGCSTNSTQYSFQRKTWSDGTRYWKSFAMGNEIQFWYSSDGSSWTQNTSATLTVSGRDFSIESDSTNAFIVYTNGFDTEARKASSYPGTNFSWGSATIVFDGTSVTDEYNYPTITRDSNSNVWIMATQISGSNYIIKTIKSSSVNDISAWGTSFTVDTSANSNKYGIINTLTSGEMYATWIDGTAIEGSKYTAGGSSTVNASVAATGDDGVRYSGSGFTTTSTYNTAGSYSGLNYHSYARFTGITVSGTITSSYITVTYNSSSGSPLLSVYGVKADNPAAPTTAAQFDAMSLTTANTSWNGAWSSGANQSPSLNSVFQELVDTYTISNDAVIVEIRNNGATGTNYNSSVDYSGNSSQVVTLHIEYASGGWGTPDAIDTGTSGVSSNLSALTDSSGNIHLTYIDSSGHVSYKKYTTSWQTTVTLDSNAGNNYTSISLDTSDNSLYAFWIRGDHIYYKHSVSPYASGDWDTNATDWHSGTALTNLTSDYSRSGTPFAEWTSDSGAPYTVNWDVIVVPENLWFLFSLGIIVPFYLRKKRRLNNTQSIFHNL